MKNLNLNGLIDSIADTKGELCSYTKLKYINSSFLGEGYFFFSISYSGFGEFLEQILMKSWIVNSESEKKSLQENADEIKKAKYKKDEILHVVTNWNCIEEQTQFLSIDNEYSE